MDEEIGIVGSESQMEGGNGEVDDFEEVVE
jgi:hypothetical protein